MSTHVPRQLPLLALLPGEPAGIGPELVARLACRPPDELRLVAIGDRASLAAAAASLGLALELPDFDQARDSAPGRLPCIDLPCPVPVRPGHPDRGNAAAVLAALDLAADGCRDGRFDAMVTGPVHKAVLSRPQAPFTGVTGHLAQRSGTADVVMMLAHPGLRVALVTTHLALAEVPAAITRERVTRCIEVLHQALVRDFGIAAPRIAVLGLNPHAGEDGEMGREEIERITPALEALRATGMQLEGPLPADTAFLPARLAGVDAVLAMYHDQGLPVLKHSGFEQAVNISLGLPFIRVAVDHGTALDIAGQGRADPSSLYAAVAMAADLARRRQTAPAR